MSPILAPCRARESATAVRRILVISPGSSLHARRAILVFAKAKMHGCFPLVCSIKCPPRKPQASFHRLREISWAFARQAAFSFPITILLTGRCDLVYDDFSALWGFELPSIQRGLGGSVSGQCKFFISIPRYFVIWGSNKSESVISLLSVP